MINLTKLLEHCPEGTKFYSPLFGDVYMQEITAYKGIIIYTNKEKRIMCNEDGVALLDIHTASAECMLFPSKKAYLENPTIEAWRDYSYKYTPKDKELVWCWNNEWTHARTLRFYNNVRKCTYAYSDAPYGNKYDNYAPYEGEYPDWAKEALKTLKD